MYMLLALTSAVLLGVWKFGIGRYRGAISPAGVILVSASAAAVIYVFEGALTGDSSFDALDIGHGIVGGALNVTGTVLVLKAVERGPIGVVVGVAASCALVPLLYSFAAGESLTWLAAAGIAVVCAGLVVFYVPNMRKDSHSPGVSAAIGIALIAALAWGFAIIALDVGSRVSVNSTLLISQAPQIAYALVMLGLVRRNWGGITRASLVPLALAGVALGLGNWAYFTAAGEGDIGVVSVLGSLSPVVAAVLAYVFLKQTLQRSQVIALSIVMLGTVLVVA